MITALLLIFDGSRTWEKIGSAPGQKVGGIFLAYLFPILLLSIVGESLGLLKLGMWEGDLAPRLVKPSQELVIRYQAVQTLLDLLIIFGGALFLKKVGDSFHRKHTYAQCFATLGYSLGPLYLVRVFDGVPAINTWICYGVGILLAVSALYRGIPYVMKPDPSNALGLYVMASFALIITTGLAHFLAVQVLEQKALAHGFRFTV